MNLRTRPSRAMVGARRIGLLRETNRKSKECPKPPRTPIYKKGGGWRNPAHGMSGK